MTTNTLRGGTEVLGERVTREWELTLETGRVLTASVRLVPHTNPGHVPRNPSDRYTVYTAAPATLNHRAYSTYESAMRSVDHFTDAMDARAGWARTT